MNDTPSTAGIILTNYCGQDLFDLYLSKEWYTKSGNNKRRHKMILMSKFLIAKYHFTFIGETFHRLKATGQNHYGILEYSLKTVQEPYSILVA